MDRVPLDARARSLFAREARRWWLALALGAAAVVLRPLFAPWIGTQYIYAVALPLMAAAGWLGGFGPGMLTALICVVGYGVLAYRGVLDAANFATLTALFLFVSALVGLLGEQRARARRAAIALQRAYDELDILLNNTPLVVIIWRSDGTIGRWSGRAEEVFGMPASDLVGKTIAETQFLHPAERDAVRAIAARLQHGEEHVVSRHRCLTRTGRVLICDWYSSAVKDAKGRTRSVLTLGLDVTEQERAAQELKAADESKNRFLAVLAHELRNPLAALRNASHLVREGAQGETMPWVADSIDRQVSQIGRMLEDLLDVSRITRNRLALQRRVFAVQEAITVACEQTRCLLDAAGQNLVLDLPDAPLYIDADPLRMTQVFANLMANAARYSTRPAQVRVSARAEDGNVTIRVEDEGVGIADQDLARVFDMFAQAHDATLGAGGLGIGLALVRGLVELHGGSVRAQSDGLGRGSTFTVTLPQAPVPVSVSAHA